MAGEVRLSAALAAALLAIPAIATTQEADRFPPATPESQGMSAEALEELAGVVRGFVEADLAIGAEMLVVKNRRTVFHDSFGWRDRDDEVPLGRDSIYNIRSMTKPFTGAAIQILADRGKLSLDDAAAEYIPGFDNDDAREITIRQLLSHHGGLPVSILSGLGGGYDDLLAMANEVGKRGPQFEPGSKLWYSDAGSDTLGAVVEVASGMLLDEFVRKELLEPLGMNDSFWLHEEGTYESERISSLYGMSPGNWHRFSKHGNPSFYPFAWGSQSLYSTPMDYAKLLALWMDGGVVGDRRILSAEAVERTLTPVSPLNILGFDAPYPTGFEGLESCYGQMAMVYMDVEGDEGAGPEIIGHGGSDGTMAWCWPELDLMILLFTQSRGGPAVLLIEPFIDYLLLHPERQKEPVDHLERYLGTWSPNADAEDPDEFMILIQNGHLALDIEGNPFVFELWDANEEGRWVFQIESRIAVSFEESEGGGVERMWMHEPEGEDTPFRRLEKKESTESPSGG